MPRLYMIGVSEYTKNDLSDCNTLLATALNPSRIGLTNMIRVSVVVRASWDASNPGVMSRTSDGAHTNSALHITTSATPRILMMALVTRHASSFFFIHNSVNIGMKPEDSAPTTKRLYTRSGMRNAA